MRSFAIFLALIALALAGIAAFAYPAWLLTDSLGLGFKFHRVASRIAMLAFLVGFLFVARRLRVSDRTSLGYGLPAPRFFAELGKALILGAVLMLPVLATMIALDMRELKPGLALDAAGWAKLIGLGLGSGLVVAFIEETAMRGAMQSAITRESGPVAGILLVSLVYAASHFFAKARVPPETLGPGSGLDMLARLLGAFANPASIIDAFLCLAAVGVLLGVVRQLTGNIAACIGLHAGWVAIIAVVRETSIRRESGAAAFLMSDYDGFIGWMVLGWTVVIGGALWWWYGSKGDRSIFRREK
jgi:membrane protease YdiL (CAAX protease family)